jgi:hypothetical protein
LPSWRSSSFSKGVQARNVRFFVRQLVVLEIFLRRQFGPTQVAGLQIFAVVSGHFKKRVVCLSNPVELTGHNAGYRRLRGVRMDMRTAAF